MKKQVSASACGKIIVSGEHAVVYGNPALAFAVGLSATTVLTKISHNNKVIFVLPNWNYQAEFTREALHKAKKQIDDRYKKYLEGKRVITKVLQHDYELIQYAFAYLSEHFSLPNDIGIKIKIISKIPIGCGMGSSAAIIISLLRALDAMFNLHLSKRQYLTLGKTLENLQHGKSSGLDLCVALYGGWIYFKQGKIKRLAVAVPRKFYLINTGRPLSTTGECVVSVKRYFASNVLLQEFEQITREIVVALKQSNWQSFQDGVRRNSKILQRIGVVPRAVQQFIYEIEQRGGAAKICGAGSVRGSAAGVVMAVGISAKSIRELAAKYDYRLL
jgi:mevalonate kinase